MYVVKVTWETWKLILIFWASMAGCALKHGQTVPKQHFFYISTIINYLFNCYGKTCFLLIAKTMTKVYLIIFFQSCQSKTNHICQSSVSQLVSQSYLLRGSFHVYYRLVIFIDLFFLWIILVKYLNQIFLLINICADFFKYWFFYYR